MDYHSRRGLLRRHRREALLPQRPALLRRDQHVAGSEAIQDRFTEVYAIEHDARHLEIAIATDQGVFKVDMGDLSPGNWRGFVAQYDSQINGAYLTRLWFDPEDPTGYGATGSGNLWAFSDSAGNQHLLVEQGLLLSRPSTWETR